MSSVFSRTLVSTVFLLSVAVAHAGSFFERDGVAIEGYDTVAYFDLRKAVKGSSAHTADYKGSKFYFSTPKNRDLFAANPGRYAPQYDGFCAFGVAKGARAKTDAEAFRIVDGKLYLNYDRSVQADWDKDRKKYISKANRMWGSVRKLTTLVR